MSTVVSFIPKNNQNLLDMIKEEQWSVLLDRLKDGLSLTTVIDEEKTIYECVLQHLYENPADITGRSLRLPDGFEDEIIRQFTYLDIDFLNAIEQNDIEPDIESVNDIFTRLHDYHTQQKQLEIKKEKEDQKDATPGQKSALLSALNFGQWGLAHRLLKEFGYQVNSLLDTNLYECVASSFVERHVDPSLILTAPNKMPRYSPKMYLIDSEKKELQLLLAEIKSKSDFGVYVGQTLCHYANHPLNVMAMLQCRDGLDLMLNVIDPRAIGSVWFSKSHIEKENEEIGTSPKTEKYKTHGSYFDNWFKQIFPDHEELTKHHTIILNPENIWSFLLANQDVKMIEIAVKHDVPYYLSDEIEALHSDANGLLGVEQKIWPLTVACCHTEYKNVDTARYLLNVFAEDIDQNEIKSCVMSAAFFNDIDMLKMFHDHRLISLQFKTEGSGFSPLHQAASQGAKEAIDFLIEEIGFSLDTLSDTGISARALLTQNHPQLAQKYGASNDNITSLAAHRLKRKSG